MKKISLLVAVLAMVGVSFAQLPDGSYGQNFSLYEIDKTTGNLITTNPITLYQYTDAGISVIMDVSATWCGPCWNYHTGGALETLYAQHGPNGTASQDVQVLFVEGSHGNYASLSGTGADANGSASQGNWLAGTEYPVLPLNMGENQSSYNSFHNNYNIAYFPTVYLICPNRLVYETGQKSADQLYAAISSVCPQYDNTLENNALIVEVTDIPGVNYCTANITPKVKLQNVGTAALTSAEFSISCNGQTTTHTWTGNLSRYDVAEVTMPAMNVDANGTVTYTVTITNVNGTADTDPTMNTSSTDFAVVQNGEMAPYSDNFNGDMDGWFMDNGLLGLYNVNGSHNYAIYFDGYSYSSGVTENLYVPMLNISNLPTPTLHFDVAHKRYNSASERLKVQYSIDCGDTWTTLYNKAGAELSTAGSTTSQYVPSSDNDWRTEIVDLSSIAVRDQVIIRFNFTSGYGNVVWIDNVEIVDGTGVVETTEELSIYPNPASSILNINSSEIIDNIAIYNLQGQLVMSEAGNIHAVNVSNLATGSYVVRIQTVNGTVSNQRFVKE